MQDKYINHYLAVIFHKWFQNINKSVGDSPFRAVVHNHMYVQDPADPTKVRIQSFIEGLREFIDNAKEMDDPDPPPVLYSTKITESAIKEMQWLKDRGQKMSLTLGGDTVVVDPITNVATFISPD